MPGLFDVIHEARDQLGIIRIIVARGSEKPYHLRKFGMSEKGCFIRIGSASEPMPSRMIENLFATRTRNSITRIRSPRQDLRFEQLSIYYQEAGLTLGEKFASNLELLTEEGVFNYAAYLLADENGNSTQVAKYVGDDRVDLLESKEYGYCCLVKTCKQVLDRLEGIENITVSKITPRERIDRQLWNRVALREAIINAIIHNDYATELVPKFEVFSDRIELTSAGMIHLGQEQEEFFAGYSHPRNKALMRIFKDLGMVEHLGSGMPRILNAYSQESFTFSAQFIRVSFSMDEETIALQKSLTNTGDVELGGSGISSEKGSEKSSEKILRHIEENAKITIEQLAEKIGISTRAIEKNLKKLQEIGSLSRFGSAKDGYWKCEKEEYSSNSEVSSEANKFRAPGEYYEKSSEKNSEKILRYIAKNSKVTIDELAEKIGISTRAIEKNLKKLQESNRLKRVGPDKGGFWQVIG